MELRDNPYNHKRAAIKRTRFFRFVKATEVVPTLSLRDPELASSSTSHCKEECGPKWKVGACTLADCP